MGAWIETLFIVFDVVQNASLPAWERGLKQPCMFRESMAMQVAPRVGAWIETRDRGHQHNVKESLPAWERGLKLFPSNMHINSSRSLPAWERGLKPVHVDLVEQLELSLPAWERGLKRNTIFCHFSVTCRSPRGSVD